MKIFQLSLGITTVFTLGLLPTAPTLAEIAATPSALVIHGSRGENQNRTLVLESEVPVTNLEITPLDLTREDNAAVIPSDLIQPRIPQINGLTRIPANGSIRVPILFDLSRVASSGEFRGNLRIQYPQGQLTVPLTIYVKDGWVLPLICLLFGTIFGTWVSNYQSRGKPRDEISVGLSQLRAKMRTDLGLAKAKSFQQRIEADLVDVEVAFEAERWDAARQALERAEEVWVRWRRERYDWLHQFDYVSELEQELERLMGHESPYVEQVHRSLQTTILNAPEGNPEAMRDRLDNYRLQINRYLEFQTGLQRLEQVSPQVVPQHQATWKAQIQYFQSQLDNLDPKEVEDYEKLYDELKTWIDKVQSHLLKKPITAGLRPSKPASTVLPPVPSTRTAPSAAQMGNEPLSFEWVQDPKMRLKLFSWVSGAIATLLLAGTGFNQLYISNPTFGANPWTDYFTLLAWGFGAEATRESITKVVRDLDLAGSHTSKS
jgi:hypothetical protein